MATLELVFDDPDVGDSHTVEVDWGDGSPLETFNVSTGSQFFSTTHQYLDDNPTATPFDFNSIQVRVIDAAATNRDGFDDDQGVEPGADQPANLAGGRRSTRTASLSSIWRSTSRALKTRTRWRSTGATGRRWKCSTCAPGSQFFSTTHQYLDDQPPSVTTQDTYQINVRVVDDDGGDVAGTTLGARQERGALESADRPAGGDRRKRRRRRWS